MYIYTVYESRFEKIKGNAHQKKTTAKRKKKQRKKNGRIRMPRGSKQKISELRIQK